MAAVSLHMFPIKLCRIQTREVEISINARYISVANAIYAACPMSQVLRSIRMR